MPNLPLLPNRGTEDGEERKISCNVCKTFLTVADKVRAYNDAGIPDGSNVLVDVAFESSESSDEWIITASELFNGCDEHQRFLHPYIWRPEDERLKEISISFNRGRLLAIVTYIHEGDDREWATVGAELLLLNEESSRPGMGLARTLDREFIDTELLTQWKKTCANRHGNTCLNRITTLRHPLSYLIDTQEMCLVPATPDAIYVALSYVWGQVPMLKLTRENVEDLQKPGVLRKLESHLPRTIRDSIGLVPLLEERYLWVDSLCIPQNDEEETRRHIRQMAAIFENASFTIVVCDGEDADSGLRGLRHSSQPRTLPEILRLAPGANLTARMERRHDESPWSERGWTLQEQIFSRRSLLFFKDTVQWMCRSSKFYEDVDAPYDLAPEALVLDGGEKRAQLNPMDLSLDVPDLTVLCHLISRYTMRKLTYQEDVIPAFSSMLGAMRRAFPRGFIHGLPVSFLDASLIWRSSSSRLARREASRKAAVCPPSWTWAGWRGYLNDLVWTASCYMKDRPRGFGRAHWKPFQVIPMLVWHTKESKSSDEQRIIPFQNDWHDCKARFMGKEHGLPDGWVYRPGGEGGPASCEFGDDPECQITWEDLQTPYFYEHESCPGRRFWHPVPIGTAAEDSEEEDDRPQASPSQKYLCARTQKAQLWAAKPHWDDKIKRAVSCEGPDDFVVRMFGQNLLVETVLRDQEGGADVGELCPDAAEDLERIRSAHPSAVSVDVVAISRGLHVEAPMPVEKETWSFYNVLWVEWEDGIAYRKGVGRVKRSVWEKLEKEDVSLIMG